MRHWQQLSIEDRLDVIEITSAKKHLPQLAVEKDWWVTMVLKALSNSRHFRLMSFKGGTSRKTFPLLFSKGELRCRRAGT